MPARFDLTITADYPNRTAELRLLDEHGSQLAYRQTDFKTFTLSQQQGLFDLRNYLRHYVEPGQEEASVAAVGVCIAEQVLGEEIFKALWASEAQRTLRIELPGASDEENHLAEALARVPWEIARPAADRPTLAERNLVLRVVHDREAPATEPLDLEAEECLRVLFVFAEAPGSRPLAARLERQQLRRLFEREIYPRRRVVADFLTHGVTRERLKAQIADRGGYHVLHWSGHGHLNLLELAGSARAGGGSDHLSGGELLDLCGGFIPRLVFLSACHSGDILRVASWKDFLAIAEGREALARETAAPTEASIELAEAPGYTGTAHALLERGVPSVVAMRYAVGDDYARDLAVEVYRALLAHTEPKSAAAALTMARQSLLDPGRHDLAAYAVCDHATPVLYGSEDPGLSPSEGRSPALDTGSPRLHQIAELRAEGHEHFVGRTWELAGLGSEYIGTRSGGDEAKPVAVITGLGGMGKTALVAEALSLWERRFEWVLLYQAKPSALGFDATLRDVHMKLHGELRRYHDHVKAHPADAVYRAPSADFTGEERQDRLIRNLVRAMRDEAILLVLDNFETHLKPRAEPATEPGEPLWACQDPAWDRCLAELGRELAGTASRVLITSRRPLAALDGTAVHRVLLGPLPPGEAALYLRTHAELRKLLLSGDEGERALAMRLLEASRFHPLLMDRLARLATGGPELRPQLLQALEALETSQGYDQLPEPFAGKEGDEKELAYLNDALATSLDQLIGDAGPDARLLLWTIGVANEPVALALLRDVWSGESHEQQQLRGMKQMLSSLSSLPPELQEKLKGMPPELRAKLDELPAEAPARPDLEPLQRHLVAVGLVTEERTGADDENPDLTCHELVRERIRAWMEEHPEERGELTEDAIRLAYAERLEAVFHALQHENMTTALEAGSRALVYCVQAEAWDRLGGFASALVTSATDPRLLTGLLPHLAAAADSAPEGRERWRCLSYLADALRNAGRPDASVPFYEQAATQARTAAEAGGKDDRQAWSDVAVITGNWAHALFIIGDPDASRRAHLDSAEAKRKARSRAIRVIGSELEALRIDILQGKAAEVLPQVEDRLAKVQDWWEQHRAGQAVPEAPDPEYLARVLIGALDIANDADRARRDWASALRRTDAVLEVKRALQRPVEDIARDRMNRAVVLNCLGRFAEAKAELEACLQIFQNDPTGRSKTLSSLAELLAAEGDIGEAILQERRALALCEQLPDPGDRSISHNNLANYLERSGTPSDLAESTRHQLAALVYRLVAGLGQLLQTSIRNYAIRFRRARSEGISPSVPRVAELLADPAFRPLKEWLEERQADVAEIQGAVDEVLTLAQKAAQE